MSRFRFVLLTFMIPLTLAGCGDGLNRVPIEGTLTSMGKTPIDGAVLIFIPGEGTPGEGAIGQTDAAGKFTVISSRNDDSGIPPGKYRVRVSRLVDGQTNQLLPADATEADYPNSIESIPPPYAGDNSPLEAEISDSGGALVLDIPKKFKGQK